MFRRCGRPYIFRKSPRAQRKRVRGKEARRRTWTISCPNSRACPAWVTSRCCSAPVVISSLPPCNALVMCLVHAHVSCVALGCLWCHELCLHQSMGSVMFCVHQPMISCPVSVMSKDCVCDVYGRTVCSCHATDISFLVSGSVSVAFNVHGNVSVADVWERRH